MWNQLFLNLEQQSIGICCGQFIDWCGVLIDET